MEASASNMPCPRSHGHANRRKRLIESAILDHFEVEVGTFSLGGGLTGDSFGFGTLVPQLARLAFGRSMMQYSDGRLWERTRQ